MSSLFKDEAGISRSILTSDVHHYNTLLTTECVYKSTKMASNVYNLSYLGS